VGSLKVFVSGPLTQGDQADNVQRAIEAGIALYRHGFLPLIPHLNVAVEEVAGDAITYEHYMECDLAWLECADAVVRLPGHSPGGDREVERACSLGIPVYHSVLELVSSTWKPCER
jgi:hypothetical protein